MLIFPETPYWLIEANQPNLAAYVCMNYNTNPFFNIEYLFFRKSLQFFRGANYDITAEINEIKEKHKINQDHRGEAKSWVWTFQKLKSSSFFKPFSCVGILYILAEAYGINSVLTYMVFILKDSGSGTNLIKYGPILVGSARVLAGGNNK